MLKTDKNFIDAIHFFQDDMEIAATTIIAAGHILRFKIQAEGVAHFGTLWHNSRIACGNKVRYLSRLHQQPPYRQKRLLSCYATKENENLPRIKFSCRPE
ncbi:MAG: hypothetical protein PSV18_13930 [Methylobacter sp.]|nr:hypothetical protein [Candidatus Methylobacter titanis]